MTSVRIQKDKRENTIWCCHHIGFQNFVNPHQHHFLFHPRILLKSVFHFIRIWNKFPLSNPPTRFSFENNQRSENLTWCCDSHSKCGSFCVICQFLDLDCSTPNEFECFPWIVSLGDRSLIHVYNECSITTRLCNFGAGHGCHEILCIRRQFMGRMLGFVGPHPVYKSMVLHKTTHRIILRNLR